ncbi:endoribonuclease Dicer [Nymphalis io]|uniref:endoribonuclease Dicer n=1 Tax=Inachis io TaxID=171585 RepID=UPI0021694BD2|nr:endoribonuclease Dicer [Nymphalis io]XP_050348803.1 endoribonuclease Dicer [Nymphalis io]XP_050348805.1 endoribonuclease Dicer [Nymphalis io]XP_050348806.1 endoribonuclease Dicer [Nymphalis io]XP_050348807.1 endoribonuclease Dicer [Nymphalis io]
MNASDTTEFTSRFYQTQLEEIAVRRNTIIFLPTGSGKTFIAIRLIKRLREALKKPWGEGGKRCFFLVNTVPLVAQQSKVIRLLCPVDVNGYTSEDNVDYWDKSKWNQELTKYQVIVMTSQILSDMLTHRYVSIADINLLIFDECHHAVDDHPMRTVMKHFEDVPKNKHPRVLGLTATLLNSNVKLNKVEETLRKLEATFQATIATVNDMGEVAIYSTNPHESVQYFRLPALTNACEEAIMLLKELQEIVMSIKLPMNDIKMDLKLKPWQRDISNNPTKITKAIKNMIESMILTIKEMGAYGGALGILAYITSLERSKRRAVTEEEELLYNIAVTHSVEARATLLQSMSNDSGYSKIVRNSSEKVLQLLNILKEYNPKYYLNDGVTLKINLKRGALSGIILTQQRYTSKVLYNLLKDVKTTNPDEFGFLKHDYIVGFKINPLTNTREQHYTKKLSLQALLKFKNGDLNCVISTSVLEEGVDVPHCSLVVKFDVPLEYRSYIQSKGRARSKDSSFVLFIDEANKFKFQQQYLEFQKIEQYIIDILYGKASLRTAPTEEDVQENLYEVDDVPPFVTKHGARLSGASAISLLNRYCSSLPTDHFTILSPMWILEKVTSTGLTLITVVMPISCKLKDPIQGKPSVNLRAAKRSAALAACAKLYEVGELDELTLLPRQHGKTDFNSDEVKACFPNWRDEQDVGEGIPNPGTKSRVRKHTKLYPKCLNGPPSWNKEMAFYLHVINLKTAFDEPKDSRDRALYNLLQSKDGYGFLTLQPLPIICDFPLFLTVGEVDTKIEVNYAKVVLDPSLFELVKRFHFFIFDQVLEVSKKFLIFDGKINNLYVVPIVEKSGYDIDWDVMQTYNEIRPVAVPSVKERMALNVTKETYLNSVVTPWYRGSILPDRYIVSNVLEYMTPRSRFDCDTFSTFEDYYLIKYNLEIFGNKDQPLLEVRNISSRLACLLPRAASLRALSDKQRKLAAQAQGDDRPRGFAEVFVPELCLRYAYPGRLWYKAVLLPSLVHRVTMLLTADELRAEIAAYVKIGQRTLLKGEEWLPVQVDLPIAIKSLLSNIEEPTAIASIDRINNPIDETIPKPVNIMSVKESVYQLQKKKISKEYPWDESKEPIDIDRNLSTVTVMDIECYDAFVTSPLFAVGEAEPGATAPAPAPAPVRSPPAPALLPPPPRYDERLRALAAAGGPQLRDVLAALTTIGSHDSFNLERAETLGDSFLKFAATLYLFHKFPAADEGQLTNIKCRLIGNRNLYYAGERANLAGRMKVDQLSPRSDFVVPGFSAPKEVADFIEEHQIRPTFMIGMNFPQADALSGTLSSESKLMMEQRFADCDRTTEHEPQGRAQNAMQCYINIQAVSDKSVADCVEALIGTYLMSGGISAAIGFLEWTRVLPPEDNVKQFLHKKVDTVLTQKRTTEQEIDWLLNNCRTDIETIIDYKFKDPSLLLEALSHASYIRNRLTNSYERLEFLGDAILDFLITAHIFENFGKLTPGDLTDLRSALVNNVTFASYVVKLGLHKFLCFQMNPVLETSIKTFVEHQEERDHEIVEDVLYLIDEEDSNVAQYIDVPKVLSDIFEAIVGAIYLDCGGNLSKVWSTVYKIMHKEINNFSMCVPKQPVRVLMEMIHACPRFGKPQQSTSTVRKVIVPVNFSKEGKQHTAYGIGTNKSQAKRAAAKVALKILGA